MHAPMVKYLLLAVALSAPASAHTTFTGFYVDGVPQGDGTCVRMSNSSTRATFPIANITSVDMACGMCLVLVHELSGRGGWCSCP
jgi:hypothetical protein